jgi:hypothetical protein
MKCFLVAIGDAGGAGEGGCGFPCRNRQKTSRHNRNEDSSPKARLRESAAFRGLCNAIPVGVPNPTLLHWVKVLQPLCLVFVTQLRCKNDCVANGGVAHLHSKLQSNFVAKPLQFGRQFWDCVLTSIGKMSYGMTSWRPSGRQLGYNKGITLASLLIPPKRSCF